MGKKSQHGLEMPPTEACIWIVPDTPSGTWHTPARLICRWGASTHRSLAVTMVFQWPPPLISAFPLIPRILPSRNRPASSPGYLFLSPLLHFLADRASSWVDIPSLDWGSYSSDPGNLSWDVIRPYEMIKCMARPPEESQSPAWRERTVTEVCFFPKDIPSTYRLWWSVHQMSANKSRVVCWSHISSVFLLKDLAPIWRKWRGQNGESQSLDTCRPNFNSC